MSARIGEDRGRRAWLIRAARWTALGGGLVALPAGFARVLAETAVPSSAPGCEAWPQWAAFKRQFIGDGGRVVDATTPRQQTVSEAQAYAMFFSLVADDRRTFDRLLDWTEDNLAGGDLAARLPAWLWGRRDDGSFGVVDDNAASDADLWLAYALGEAGRRWSDRRYVALASLLADRILREEVASLPGLGLTLLPGPRGFAPAPSAPDSRAWRLNPSYLPLPLLRWFARRSADARWQALLRSSLTVLKESAPRGFAPDWVRFQAAGPTGDDGHFAATDDPAATERKGSYDAIRVYLWLGLTSHDDPARADLLARYAPMADAIERGGTPPEMVDVGTGEARGVGPAGFSCAALPFLATAGRDTALKTQLALLQAHPPRADAYYDNALSLFGGGWFEHRFRFDVDGALQIAPADCQVS